MDSKEEYIYKKAVNEIKLLAEYCLAEIDEFAEKNDYEKSWVRDKFRDVLNEKIRKDNS